MLTKFNKLSTCVQVNEKLKLVNKIYVIKQNNISVSDYIKKKIHWVRIYLQQLLK